MLEGIRSVRDLPLDGQRVFIRVDFNVPLKGGEVSDDTRIHAALPTIRHVIEAGGRPVLASHLGRPKGAPTPGLSLEPVGARLAELLEVEVLLADDCVGDGPRKVVTDLRDGQVALLENLRFQPGETKDDEAFAKELARLADVYVNDAFGAVHRAHASVSALPKMMRDRGAGLLLEKELSFLGGLRGEVERPYLAILGGAKVDTKIGILEDLLARVDGILIGGAMANTFLAAQGHEVGKSLYEEDKLALARTILNRAASRGVAFLLPRDVVVAASIEAEGGEVVGVSAIPEDMAAYDIGPATVEAYASELANAKTIFWNGPMGLFEKAPFAAGTLGVAEALAGCAGTTVVGGGDSVAAIRQMGLFDRFDHVSTGGGASLELLEGRKLPGVEALRAEGARKGA